MRGQAPEKGIWQALRDGLARAPDDPAVLCAALLVTGLLAFVVLADQAIEPVRERLPSDQEELAPVFRAPYPAMVAN